MDYYNYLLVFFVIDIISLIIVKSYNIFNNVTTITLEYQINIYLYI